ncbi:unnamed protein product [Dibothriocephalus latus]|uniref:Uncharacterized protein n=1 Tax=Dibothriocephalus latus TaxID=60516 RepID=A0A3P7MPG8_DIBLA|nr:unnamed protein product [Dibothriocephalus latus]
MLPFETFDFKPSFIPFTPLLQVIRLAGSRTAPKFTPGDIGGKKKRKKVPKPEIKPVDPNAIWDADEVPEVEDVQDIYDPRPQPEYEILFKQDVTTEDIYLQMGNKTPTTASCEYMVWLRQTPLFWKAGRSLPILYAGHLKTVKLTYFNK